MFYKNDLNNVNFSFVDLRNAENIEHCFSECENKKINENSTLNLKNSINLNYSFYKTDLSKVNFSFLDVRNAESVIYGFSQCENIKINDKSVLKLKNFINIDHAFYKDDLYNINFSFLQALNTESI